LLCFSDIKEKQCLGDKFVKVTHAPEPDNIIWANLGIGWFNQAIRKSISLVICIAFLLAAAAITIVLKNE